jgi:hypothetical protein
MIKLEETDLDSLFKNSNEFEADDATDIVDAPLLLINLDEVNDEAKKMATLITERLSNYYFDEKYLEQHPYVPTKIMNAMDNIRRLLKMLSVNEKAQDALISNITLNAGKGSLYASLTSLQNSMLSIQSQLNNLTTSLEVIFKEMQDECERTFESKDKDIDEFGGKIVRGSRDFIKDLNEKLYGTKKNLKENNEIVNN